jgi:hypothetical protein
VTSGRFPRHGRWSGVARWAGRMAGSAPARPRPDPDPHALQPAARVDPLSDPVAIIGHCIIGDQIRLPATWCDMAGCPTSFADPAALGEADNQARALAAGWAQDVSGRLMCPACQQPHHSPSVRLAPQPDAAAAGGHHAAAGAARPGSGASRSARSAAGRQPRAAGLGRHRREAQWPRLLAPLASDHNSWTSP